MTHRDATSRLNVCLHDVGATDLGPHEGSFARELLKRIDVAVQQALPTATEITHVGFGAAEVKEVASNRRILGEDGKVRATRYTTCRDPLLRAEPAGVIDPELSSLAFWNKDQPVAVLSYYACHPQSYYRTGVPSPDFPRIARFARGQDVPNVLHVHFNGAGGNIGAGKVQRRLQREPADLGWPRGGRHEAGVRGG